MQKSADVVICGAGIAGISAAYFLARRGVRKILLVDERPPLDLTSSRSTECYRNWWPVAPMVLLMNRSIDLLEGLSKESGNIFRMNRRGYLYVTGDERNIPALRQRAQRPSGLGAGPLRTHTVSDSSYQRSEPEGYEAAPQGADLLLGGDLVRRYFPGLTERVVGALHVRRAGWLSAQQLGMYMLDSARKLGVEVVRARTTGVVLTGDRVSGVHFSTGERVPAGNFVNAAGPFLQQVGRLAGMDLPVHTELHLKVAFSDALGIIDRGSPLLVWDDPQLLPWEPDEWAALNADESTRWLTGQFPIGAHTRPEGGSGSDKVLMLWEYKPVVMEPVWPPPLDRDYPELVLRGLASMLPGFRRYFGRVPRPQLDGGYYTKTRENLPLVGPMGPQGAFVIGALSGYGIMSACGLGDLLASHVTGAELPIYAPDFMLDRYSRAGYAESIGERGENGQL